MKLHPKPWISCLVWVFLLINLARSPEAISASLSCQDLFINSSESLSAQNNLYVAQADSQINSYLHDTLHSLEEMRGANGLVQDTILIHSKQNGEHAVQTLNSNTSPTNVAIDLLIQSELMIQKKYKTHSSEQDVQKSSSLKIVSKILSTLAQLSRHEESGLFFSWYSTTANSAVASPNISSIDNLHLAIALWTIKETFAKTAIGEQAQALLAAMNFSMFYDESSGLVGGNFSYSNGRWTKDSYNFSNLGSEARILYTAGWALGLFKDYSNQTDFLEKASSSLQIDVADSPHGRLLQLWDGSAFQLFFPKMFVNEESFSPVFKKLYESNGNLMISEGTRRHLPMPAAHSPGVNHFGISEDNKTFAIYNDKAGIKGLVSKNNLDLHDRALEKKWDQTFTPYALFMAATSHQKEFLSIFKQIESIKSGSDSLYLPGMGWMDGFHLKGELAGQVVPAQLAVNQGMIAMALLQMQAADGLSASGRAIKHNIQINARMKQAYKILDTKLNERGLR